VEFTISLLVLIPLLLGAFVFGFKLVRSLQMEQIVRDVGHMYARNVDFRSAGSVQVAQQLASGYDLTSSGTSELILSQISVVQQADCDAGNPTLPSGTHCTNLNYPVYVEELILGNSGDGTSNFGCPPLQGDSTVSAANRANNTLARASGFSSVLTLQANETAYVVEMFNLTPEFNIAGFSGAPLIYARSVF